MTAVNVADGKNFSRSGDGAHGESKHQTCKAGKSGQTAPHELSDTIHPEFKDLSFQSTNQLHQKALSRAQFPDENTEVSHLSLEHEPIILRSSVVTTPDTQPSAAAPKEQEAYNWPATPDADQFFEPSYRPILTQLIDYLVNLEGPIESNRLARIISKAHGWKRTGARIRQHIDANLGNNELHLEDKTTFIWASGSHQEKISFRNIPDRDIIEISRHELFGLIAAHPELDASEDQVREMANILQIKRLSQKVERYIADSISLYRNSF